MKRLLHWLPAAVSAAGSHASATFTASGVIGTPRAVDVGRAIGGGEARGGLAVEMELERRLDLDVLIVGGLRRARDLLARPNSQFAAIRA